MKKIIAKITVLFLLLTSLWSQAKLTKTDSNFFWRIDGQSLTGEPSTVYLLGTIHIGNETTKDLLSPEILDAFNSSETLYAELSADDLSRAQTSTFYLLMRSVYKNPDDYVTNQLNAKQLETMYTILGETANRLKTFHPWVISTTMDEIIRSHSSFKPEYGVDQYLMNLAKEQERTVLGLDKLGIQLKIITYGTPDEQLEVLKAGLDDFESVEKTLEVMNKSYLCYSTDDGEGMNKLMADAETDLKEKHPDLVDFSSRQSKLMITDRNSNWAEQITQMINNGGTYFIMAGSAHFIYRDTVFYYLKELGTIE